jgi:A/G-specific adenine glycosylase
MSRLFAVETPLPAAKAELKALAGDLVGTRRPGDWAQALMDLGATVCRPKSPLCEACPLRADCRAFAQGDPATFPKRTARAERPHRQGVVYVLLRGGDVALTRRPDKGLLGGMLGLPTTDWRAAPWTLAQAQAVAPCSAPWRRAGEVSHGFTHFSLDLMVLAASPEEKAAHWIWLPANAARQAVPSLFAKALDLFV